MTKIWDITQKISPSTPIWPDCPAYSDQQVTSIIAGDSVNTSALTMFSHMGTHVDAPFHYDQHGQQMEQCSLLAFIGTCFVLDVSHIKSNLITVDALHNNLPTYDRVLFKTYKKQPTAQWDQNFTAISVEVIQYLSKRSCQLIGTDAASIDPQHSKSLDAHKAVLKYDMRIIEGLALDHVSEGLYELIALPLPIVGGDASPVRAILRSYD